MLTHIALIGHCGFDSSSLTRLAQQIAPDAQVLRVNKHKNLPDITHPKALWLVNRALDGQFDAADGIELITQINATPTPPQLLLVSNFPDAQANAQAAGALPGFGKNDLNNSQLATRIAASITRKTEGAGSS